MTLIQSLVIAILQGATELFPVSSLGHAVILPRLMGWAIDQKAPEFLPFLVVLHLGTAFALLLFYWRDWFGFATAILGRGTPETIKSERHVFTLVVAATVPAVILGFALEHTLRGFFGAPSLAAIFLILNGFVLFGGERLRRRNKGTRTLAEIDWRKALMIGACQALALIPGLSRSGVTMVGGLLAGLSHKDAARFSFLLATPVIAGGGVLEVPKLLKMHDVIATEGGTMVIAGIVAGVTAYASVALLTHYFKKHDFEALNPFAYYCWAAGVIALVFCL
jgi:undecaprenyl-diphosphatase